MYTHKGKISSSIKNWDIEKAEIILKRLKASNWKIIENYKKP